MRRVIISLLSKIASIVCYLIEIILSADKVVLLYIIGNNFNYMLFVIPCIILRRVIIIPFSVV